jgi:hypothetical protein
LKQTGVCSILNTIDRQGFFDYDPQTFSAPQGGGRSYYLSVNAWRSNSIEIDNLDQWLSDPAWLDKQLSCTHCTTRPVILAALANTFDFLNRYHPDGLKTFQPDRLAVWISAPWLAGTPYPWLLQDIPLSQMYSQSRCTDGNSGKALEFSGTDAIKVSETINQATTLGYAPIFTDGTLTLQVVDQWLLPGENAAACQETTNQLPAANLPTPDFQIQCQPADGVLPIPTATPIPYAPLR